MGTVAGLSRLIALVAVGVSVFGRVEFVHGESRFPNIVLIVVDDLGWSDLGCYGGDLHETPHIDRLAKSSVRFTNAYAASPVCSPTRASIMTGKHPARLNFTIWREGALRGPVTRGGVTTPESLHDLPQAERTLAEELRDAGYVTAHIGKWHLGGAENYPENHGFDVNVGGTLWGAPPTFFYPYRGPFGSQREPRYVPGLPWGAAGEYLTDRLTDEAIRVIRRSGQRPFFVQLAFHSVHTPIEAKREEVEYFQSKIDRVGNVNLRHRNATYAAMVRSVDDNVGRVLTALEGLKVDDRTVVVFVSDNGGYVNEYHDRRVTTNEPLRSGKGSLYEGGIRVPLIIRVPKSLAGRSEAGIECRTPVITTDLYATCLSVANIEQPTAVDGLDLLPLTRGEDRSFHRQALFFHYPHFYATTTPASAIRADRWKLVHYYDTDRDELYDLATDLAETQDLAAERPEKRRRLRRWLDRWLGEVGAKLPLAAADSGRRQNE